MRKILVLFMLFFVFSAKSQSQRFFYEYKFVPDKTDAKNIVAEMTVLSVEKDKSEFFSLEQLESDSLLLVATKKGIFAMPTAENRFRDRIVKKAGSNVIIYKSLLSNTKYNVSQEMNLDWKLLPEFSQILNYKVQKAVTSFGGRNWIAWFTTEIPFQDGPYKFKNLPGLIVKVEDDASQHSFELKGVKLYKDNFLYPDLKNYPEINIPYSIYVGKYKDYRKHPTADLVGLIPDQTTWEGVFKKGSQIVNELEKEELKRLAKDNNIIEIDLLKK